MVRRRAGGRAEAFRAHLFSPFFVAVERLCAGLSFPIFSFQICRASDRQIFLSIR